MIDFAPFSAPEDRQVRNHPHTYICISLSMDKHIFLSLP